MTDAIALVTASQMLVPDRESHLLVSALQQLNVPSRIVAWDQPEDWSQFSLVLIRTPWDYHERPEEFLRWAEEISRQTRLFNPVETLKWNSHKSYLLELRERGVPILPTLMLPQGSGFDPQDFPAGEMIAKPTIGIGASGIMRAQRDSSRLHTHLEELLRQGDVLIQPFAPSIQSTGETSLIFLGDTYSHAVKKTPATDDFRVQFQHGGTTQPYEPTQAEVEVAHLTIQAALGQLAYARVDLVTWEGSPVVMELEVIEPELFLRFDAAAPARFAAYLKSLL